MSVLEQIKELENQKMKLLQAARDEALATIKKAIADLAEIGFHYELVQSGGRPPASTSTGTRRQGIRTEVLNLVKGTKDGLTRADILAALDAKGDKKAEQSISNALANLKKSGDINLTDGTYTAA